MFFGMLNFFLNFERVMWAIFVLALCIIIQNFTVRVYVCGDITQANDLNNDFTSS